MPAKTHGDRLDRLEQIVEILAERQVSLEQIVADLATETRRGFDQVAEQFRETDRQIRRTDERIDRLAAEDRARAKAADERLDRLAAEDRERAKIFDQRVNDLVVAIGEFIRAQRPTS